MVVVVVYSFTIHEAVLKKGECGVDVGSIGGRVFVDGKIYRINEEVEVEEGNKKHWGGKIVKIVEEEIKTLRGENNKIVEEGIKKLRTEIKLKRERGK